MTTAVIRHHAGMDKYDWREHAKCAGQNTDMFDLRGDVKNKAGRARELCAGCPVVQRCAQDALQAPSVGMVRAGLWIPEVAGSHNSYTPSWETVLTNIAEGN